jgi:hypothetical protein
MDSFTLKRPCNYEGKSPAAVNNTFKTRPTCSSDLAIESFEL